MKTSRFLSLGAAGALFFGLLAGCGQAKETESLGKTEQALSTGLVISQVYGGGGNSGAKYTYDYVELFNRGTSAASTSGMSLQYWSSGGTGASTNVTALPTAVIPPGQYYLIQLATQNASVGDPLPTPDAVIETDADAGTKAINMAGSSGRIALVDGTTPLACASLPCTGVVDYVGFGTSATVFEGTKAPAPSATNAIFRKNGGCQETDDNGADFEAAAAAPRNSSSTAHLCTVADAGADVVLPDAVPDTIVVVDAPADTEADSEADAAADAEADAAADAEADAAADAEADAVTDAEADAAADAEADAAADAEADATADAPEDTATVEDTATTEDTATEEDTATAEDTMPADTGAADTGEDAGEIAPPEAAADDGGCGCRTAGGANGTTSTAGLAARAALGIVVARRRRR